MLTDAELDAVRRRSHDPSQYPADTLRHDYSVLLEEVTQLRQELDTSSSGEPVSLQRSVRELVREWERIGYIGNTAAMHMLHQVGLLSEKEWQEELRACRAYSGGEGV